MTEDEKELTSVCPSLNPPAYVFLFFILLSLTGCGCACAQHTHIQKKFLSIQMIYNPISLIPHALYREINGYWVEWVGRKEMVGNSSLTFAAIWHFAWGNQSMMSVSWDVVHTPSTLPISSSHPNSVTLTSLHLEQILKTFLKSGCIILTPNMPQLYKLYAERKMCKVLEISSYF